MFLKGQNHNKEQSQAQTWRREGTGKARGVRRTQCREQGSDGQADLIILELVMCQAPQGTLFLPPPGYY